MTAILHRHPMSPEKIGFDGQRGMLFETANDPQHFQFAFCCQTVTAFYLHSPCSQVHNIVQALQGGFKEFVFGRE